MVVIAFALAEFYISEMVLAPPIDNPVAAALLAHLDAVGGTAWIVKGQLRLRPLDMIPVELAMDLHANVEIVLPLVESRTKRRRVAAGPQRRYIARQRDALIKAIPGKPTRAQIVLIERISWLSWHVNVFDQKALDAGGLSAHAAREYLAYSNSLAACRT